MKKLLENWRGYLMEQRVAYSGVVLDKESQRRLLELGYPSGWKPFAHHMTITMGPLSKRDETNGGLYKVGDKVTLKVISVGEDERVKAVRVEVPHPINKKHVKHPHITVAVNEAGGGKPFHSNKIADENFEPAPGIELSGVVTEIPA